MPTKRNFDFHSESSGTALSVQVVPNAAVSNITEIRTDGCVVIHLAGDKVDETCHAALLEFLAEKLSIAPNTLAVIAGEKGELKIISILGTDSKQIDERLKKFQK